eukprot:UN04700
MVGTFIFNFFELSTSNLLIRRSRQTSLSRFVEKLTSLWFTFRTMESLHHFQKLIQDMTWIFANFF